MFLLCIGLLAPGFVTGVRSGGREDRGAHHPWKSLEGEAGLGGLSLSRLSPSRAVWFSLPGCKEWHLSLNV